MQARKLLWIGVGGLAGLVVITAALVILVFVGAFQSGRGQKSAPPPEGKQAISPGGDIVLYSQVQ